MSAVRRSLLRRICSKVEPSGLAFPLRRRNDPSAREIAGRLGQSLLVYETSKLPCVVGSDRRDSGPNQPPGTHHGHGRRDRLAGRLAADNHLVVALDLSCDDAFRLGAAGRLSRYLGLPIVLVQGAIEEPPFQPNQVDLLTYNASLHYAENIEGCLKTGARLLGPDGFLVIMDSPVKGSEPSP